MRVLIRYDVENLSDEIFQAACRTVFSEPPVDVLFQETFGQVPGAHFHDKWVHYYNRNLLMMAAYFRGEEENGQKFCDMITRQVERYTQNRRRTG